MEHEYNKNRRYDLLATVRRLRTDRGKERSSLAFDQLWNERERFVLCDELAATRRETALLKDKHESLSVITRIFWVFLGASTVSLLGRGFALTSRSDTPHITRRIRAHTMRQLNRVCIELAVQYTKGTNVSRQ